MWMRELSEGRRGAFEQGGIMLSGRNPARPRQRRR
jgi:hypothetical protein